MSQIIVLIGYQGALARATAATLERLGQQVRIMDRFRAPGELSSCEPDRAIFFPFSPSTKRRDVEQWRADMSYLESCLDRMAPGGLKRVVLRSHAVFYGSNWKNYGMMEEDRASLQPENSFDRRWAQVEERFQQRAASKASLSAAILRLTNILDPAEGDFIVRMLSSRVSLPLAGYDPRVQFLSLADAAQALASAALSHESGVFNIAGAGSVSFRHALRAASKVRIPAGRALQKPIRSLFWKIGLADFPGESLEQIRYNWTVSSTAAARRLGFSPQLSSVQALRQFLANNSGKPQKVKDTYDDFGLQPDYLDTLSLWFSFLRKIYWRVEAEGLENIPESGPGILASNHRGFMPFDGVIHRSLILEARNRHIRFLVIPSLFKFSFLSDFLIKQGGVVASQLNTRRLLDRGDLVGIFPEGINGAFRMYKGAYRLGAFGRDNFARLAIENQVPVFPAATIGHVEIFPILGRVHIPAMTRWNGWPFLPITPTFPMAPVPLPTKWHIRYLEPISVGNLRPQDAENRKIVREFSNHVRDVLQRNIDEMLARRKHIFFGRIFDRPDPGYQKSLATGDQ